MRINLYGGPGVGKSNLSSKLYAELDILGYKIELVREYIKKWAYSGKVPRSFDQNYIFSKQLRAEDFYLQHGVDHIVTDSPLPLQCFYAYINHYPVWRELLTIAENYEKKHPSINIFLDREGLEYRGHGRYQNELQALELDTKIKEFLTSHDISYKVLKTTDYKSIENYITGAIHGLQAY